MRGTKEKGASTNREEQQMAQSKSHEADVQDAQPATGQTSSQKRQTKIHAGTLYRKILAKATVDRTPRMSRSKAMNKEVVVG